MELSLCQRFHCIQSGCCLMSSLVQCCSVRQDLCGVCFFFFQVAQVPEKDTLLMSKKEMLARIDVSMGGRVAEELILGSENVTTGASSDFEAATRLATSMVVRFGMSEAVSHVHSLYHMHTHAHAHAHAHTMQRKCSLYSEPPIRTLRGRDNLPIKDTLLHYVDTFFIAVHF